MIKYIKAYFALSLVALLLVCCQENGNVPIISENNSDNEQMIVTIEPNESQTATSANHWDSSQCIPPVVSFSYPAYIPETSLPEVFPNRETVLPTDPWEQVTTIPFNNYNESINSMVLRGNNEIWFNTSDTIFIYNIETGEFSSPETNGDIEETFGNIFVSPDGSLWVTIPQTIFSGEIVGWIERFDPETNRLSIIEDNQGLLRNPELTTAYDLTFDENGVIWFFTNHVDSYLYSYDPNTNNAREYSLPEGYTDIASIAFSPSGDLWMLDAAQQSLFKYDPITEITEPYEELNSIHGLYYDEPLTLGETLFFDNEGHLWVSDRGWLDFTVPNQPIWNRVIRSPLFITNEIPNSMQYRWIRPFFQYESSDGIYWFTAALGTIRLDPTIGEWCMFTSATNPIVEDSNHTLWMVAYGALYRYQLNP